MGPFACLLPDGLSRWPSAPAFLRAGSPVQVKGGAPPLSCACPGSCLEPGTAQGSERVWLAGGPLHRAGRSTPLHGAQGAA